MARADEDFQAFFEAEFPRLFRFAWLLVGNEAEAEDLAQEAMVRTYRSRHRIEDQDRLGAYARSIVVNHQRSTIRRRRVAESKRHLAAVPDRHTDDEGLSLWHDVLRLSPPQRAAIVLRYYEDLPEAQIAAILDRPVGTVKSDLRRGLAKLRRDIHEDVDETEGTRARE